MADILQPLPGRRQAEQERAIVAIVAGAGNRRPMLDPVNIAGIGKLFNLLDANNNHILDDGDIQAKCNVPGASPRKVQQVLYIWDQIKKTCVSPFPRFFLSPCFLG